MSDSQDAGPASETSERPIDPDIAELSYEAARDELVSIVARLEGGTADLDESLRLWDRGEQLAAHCQRRLDAAEERLDASTGDASTSDED